MKFNQSTWRTAATPIIAKVLSENAGKDEREVRKALREAYPFGERKYHPYKIWCDEVQRQIGTKWPIGHKKAWQNRRAKWKSDQEKLAQWQRLYGEKAL